MSNSSQSASISTLAEAVSIGLCKAISAPEYRVREVLPQMPPCYILRGKMSFRDTSAFLYYNDLHIRTPNLDNLHHPSHVDAFSRGSALIRNSDFSVLSGALYCLISSSWSFKNIYHFFVDSIGKLGLIRDFYDLRDIIFLVPDGAPLYTEFFNFVGLRTVIYNRSNYYFVDDLLAPSLPGITTRISVRTINYLRDVFRMVPPKKLGINLYLGRRTRDVSNVDEILEVLSANWEMDYVHLDEFSLVDQISLLKGSNFVCGAHGAAFTNSVFKEQGSVLEIFSPKFANPPFKYMHEQTSIEYKGFFPADSLELKYGKNHTDNFVVDINRFAEFL